MLNEQLESAAPTFRGLWIAEVIDQPTIVLPELQAAWTAYVDRIEATDDDEMLDADDFLDGFESDTLVAFCLTSQSLACGPVAETIWVVLDLGVEIDDDEDG